MRAAGFVIGSMLASCGIVSLLATAHVLPLLQYVPSTGTWTFHPRPGVIAMDWYFRALVTLASGAVAFVLAHGVARMSERVARPSVSRFALGLGFALIAWAALYGSLAVIELPRGPAAAPSRSRSR